MTEDRPSPEEQEETEQDALGTEADPEASAEEG
jgi:hypothetical protein